MKMTRSEITDNAEDWIGNSQDISSDEIIDREQLREQLFYTIADDEDIEAIALEIERICKERF